MSSEVEWKWRHVGVSGFEGLWGEGIGSGISCSRSPCARCADDELTDVDSVWPREPTLLATWRDVWRVMDSEKRLWVLRNHCASRLHANSWAVMSCFFSRWSKWVSCHTEAGLITASVKRLWLIPFLYTVAISDPTIDTTFLKVICWIFGSFLIYFHKEKERHFHNLVQNQLDLMRTTKSKLTIPFFMEHCSSYIFINDLPMHIITVFFYLNSK